MESDEGVLIKVGGEDFVLRASIVGFIGDTSAAHEVFNFLAPSANCFCRMCMYSRLDLHAGSVELGVPRTENLYNEHLELLRNTAFSAETKSATGMKGDSIINESRYFHLTRNKNFDLLHDFLLGVGPMLLKLGLHEYIIVQGKITVYQFNGMVSSFNC